MAKTAAKLGGHHVSPGFNGWRVYRAGLQRASSVHPTQAEAIEAGRQLSERFGTNLFIHGENGLVREVIWADKEGVAAKA